MKLIRVVLMEANITSTVRLAVTVTAVSDAALYTLPRCFLVSVPIRQPYPQSLLFHLAIQTPSTPRLCSRATFVFLFSSFLPASPRFLLPSSRLCCRVPSAVSFLWFPPASFLFFLPGWHSPSLPSTNLSIFCAASASLCTFPQIYTGPVHSDFKTFLPLICFLYTFFFHNLPPYFSECTDEDASVDVFYSMRHLGFNWGFLLDRLIV